MAAGGDNLEHSEYEEGGTPVLSTAESGCRGDFLKDD